MSGHDATYSLPDHVAREALHERCLGLVRRWQPLARSGWDHAAARQLGDELDQIATTSEEMGLSMVNGSALELAAYLCSFIDDRLVPNARDLERLASMVNALGSALSELSGNARAEVHALRGDTGTRPHIPDADVETEAAPLPKPAKATKADGPLRLPRAMCLFGDFVRGAPGLAAALLERGYQVHAFVEVDDLLAFVDNVVPGALLLDTRLLRHLPRIRARIAAATSDIEASPPLLAFSRKGDLGDRLLAMRAGAVGLFSAPLDSLRVIGRIDELLMHTLQTPWRVLLAEGDRERAGERARWLAERGMTVRLSTNGQGTLTALSEFRPDMLVVDEELADVHGLELVQLVRQQPEHAALPIILMSASGDVGHRFDAIAAGCDDVLLEPVKARHLTHALLSRLTRLRWLRDMIGASGGRDPRTGLYSRAVLLEKLGNVLGDRSAALMCVAIDHAQELRESIGLSGLAALDAHVGQLLRSQLEVTDIAAHYQDFHYFVLVHRRSRGEASLTAENIRTAFAREPWRFAERAHAITASIGLALLGGEVAGIDAVVVNAEGAQLAARHMGGDRVLWYEAKEAALLPSDPQLAARAVLGRPLRAEQIAVDFLPIVPLAGKLSGQFDLRFRVRSAQNPGTSIAYEDLASVASDRESLARMDRWLLEHTLEVREQQLKRGRQLRLLVPQSVDSVLAPDLAWWLARELKERHLSGTGLTLVLPCSPLIDTGERGRARIAELRELGVRVCLSDFGRDWAAVHALKQLEVDVVRLDPALVLELGSVRSVADTVMALVRKAHSAGAAVIAPETDNANRAHLLLRLGIDYAVGPAFSQPLAQPEFDFGRPLW
ncbi:EAL domain-containing protein [Dokdonella sp. MW10]|uniref:EAL domain-containing protein n=1 Tax=Dokdonella sp. MW10 TaxID=2992926 RepID=UPI003F7EF211